MKQKIPAKWAALVLLMVAGLIFQFLLQGYLTMALLCYGIAGLIVAFHLVGLLEKRSKVGTVLRRVLSGCLILGVLAIAATWTVILGESKGLANDDISYIVVLGAQVRGAVPSRSMRERLDSTYAYLEAHPDIICVVSGGQGDGESITEAQCMYEDLVRRGIAADRVWQEGESTNTLENLSNSLDVIEANSGTRPERIGVVSSEYHLFRACEFARAAGVAPVGIPATTENPLLRLNYYLREVVAVWYYMILGG